MHRTLGKSTLHVSPVAMGCWPISGMTSLGVTREQSEATIQAAVDHGINFFDTAYCYGVDGESEKLVGSVLGSRRDDCVLATKGGIHWGPNGQRILDASPARLRAECDASLARMDIEVIDLLYLHAPDERTSIAESAGALSDLQREGKTRFVGASNLTLQQLQEFHQVCPLTAVQPAYNMLLRQIEADLVPWCQAQQIAIVGYWPLMKGLLAGKLPRDHRFAAGDGRTKYQAFQGDEWHKNQDLLDELRSLAAQHNRTVTELVVNWTIHQPGITVALCGAKRPDQILESVKAHDWQMDNALCQQLDQAIRRRGTPAVDRAI